MKPTIENGCPSRSADGADRAVDQREPHVDIVAPEGDRLASHVGRSADDLRRADRHGAGVGPEDDVRVQHLEQCVEVALARGGEERVEDLALGVEVGVGDRALALDPAARAARELARRSGERSTIGAISSNGTANMSCRTNASRSAGFSVSSTTSSARPTASARSASCSGLAPSGRSTIGSGMRTPRGSSRRDWRERSMFSETRATTVVSQPPRFSTLSASVRLRRSHVSWTASSASLSEPSIR